MVYENYQTIRDAATNLRDRKLDIYRTLIPALEKRFNYFDYVMLSKFIELISSTSHH